MQLMGLEPKQRANGRAILRQVARRALAGQWSHADARRVGRLAIMCAMTESNLWMYANRAVPASLDLPHDKVGSDHDSLGLFQQRSPMWGTPAQLMDVHRSTDLFIDKLLQAGLSRTGSGPTWVAVQAVQRSAFPDGSNYRANRGRAFLFCARYWGPACRAVGYWY